MVGMTVCLLLLSTVAFAQEQATDSTTATYSFDFQGTSLNEALQRILAASQVELVYDPALLMDKTSSCRVEDANLGEVLDCLLEGSGLTAQRLSSGAYVIKKERPDASVQTGAASATQAASKYTVSGYMQDATTGERLIGANLYEPHLQVGTASNAYGFYSLTLPADSVMLVASYLGYETLTFRFKPSRDLHFDIHLEPVTLTSEEIEVVAERAEPIQQQTQMSTIDVPIQQVQALPDILGEVDVLRTMQLLPGVQSGTEGNSGLFVRGGSPDQNLILLDGAQVYNASHLFGMFSVFNSDAINHVQLTKGGFPARYGGRLSSVLDIGMKEGNMKRFAGEFAIGAVASRLLIEGPIKKDKTSFIVSGRRTYVDAIVNPFLSRDERGGYFFYDLNAKVNHVFSPKDRLFVSTYLGNDRFYVKTRIDDEQSDAFLEWGNITSTVRWNHLWSNKLFSNVIGTYSRYEFDVGTSIENRAKGEIDQLDYTSGIRDYGLKVDFDYVPKPDHFIRFGMNTTYHTFRPGATQIKLDYDDQGTGDLTIEPAKPINALEYALYIEDDFKINDRLKANVGLHGSGFIVTGRHFRSLQPRLSLRYLLGNEWALKASYATMKQYILLLTNSSVGLPTDLWLPATKRVPPQTSHLLAVGLARQLFKNRYEFSVEAYLKEMKNLLEFKNGANFLGVDKNWEDKVESGRGEAVGLEFFLQKKAGRTTGWIGYTLSWTNRIFENLNNGEPFPYKYDRRHDVSAVLIHRLNKWVEFSGAWVYVTGSALTLPTSLYYINPYVDTDLCFGCTIESYESRNDFRMRSHHRLDIGINFHKQKGKGMRTISIGAYNAYNRRNPFFVVLEDQDKLVQYSLFPVIPYITFRRKF